MADILIVDDNPDISATLADVLSLEGHRVRVAANGQAGLDALNERLFDVVVLDIEMPVLDGPGMAIGMFLEDLGREKIPIVLTSGFPDLPAVADSIGTPYFLAKPCDIDSLLALLARALTERIGPTPRRPEAP